MQLGGFALPDLKLRAKQEPEQLDRAAFVWHRLVEPVATLLPLGEPRLMPAASARLCVGERQMVH